MHNDLDIVKDHDRLLATLSADMKRLKEDIGEIKVILKSISAEHHADNSAVYRVMSANKQSSHDEIKAMQIEIAIIKTKLVVIGAGSGLLAGGIISLIAKFVGG